MNKFAKASCIAIAALASTCAAATEISLNRGFVASTIDEISQLSGGGSDVYSGALSGIPGPDNNPLVTIRNTTGLFNANGLYAESFYGFDNVDVNIYGTAGLIASLSFANDGYSAFHPEYVFSDISYITYQSSFPLGVHINIDSLSPVNAVPEPETYAMLVSGLMMIGIARRRRHGSRQ